MLISDWSSDVCSSALREASARDDVEPNTAFLGIGPLDRRGAERARPRIVNEDRDGIRLEPRRERCKIRRILKIGDQRFGRHAMRVGKARSEEHTSELQSLMRISYAVFCLKKKKNMKKAEHNTKTMITNYEIFQITDVNIITAT